METYLIHHGIKGQRWGVRRFQNYDGTRIKSNASNTDHKSRGQKFLEKATIRDREVGFVDPVLIELGMYAAVFTTLFAAAKIRTKKLKKSYADELQNEYDKRDIKNLKEIPKLKQPMSPEDSMKLVNPGYPNPGTTANCMLCTTAMALREKGYDVKANKITHGLYEENIDKMWSNEGAFKKIKAKKSSEILNTLEKEGDGAYGNLTVTWALGGGHSVFWKNVNGKVHIYDGQSSEEYDLSNSKNSYFLQSIMPNGSMYSRLDKATPTEMVLAAVRKREGENSNG